MKKRYLLMNWRQLLTTVSFMLILFSAKATYTLTDSDVVASNGFLSYCEYDFSDPDIIIPSELDGTVIKYIKSAAFKSKGITSVQLPSTVIKIGEEAFYGNNITQLDLSYCPLLRLIDKKAFCNNDIAGELDLSSSTKLETIAEGAFWMNDITSISFVNCSALNYIGESAFNNNNITGNLRFTEAVNLSVIDDFAFATNTISSVQMAANYQLVHIGANAFGNNPSLSFFTLPAECRVAGFLGWMDRSLNTYSENEFINDLTKEYIADVPHVLLDADVINTYTCQPDIYYDFFLKRIIIPDSLDGYPVKKLDPSYNLMNESLTYISFPSTLEELRYASGNTLDSVDLSRCVNLETIYDSGLKNCGLSTIDITACVNLKEIQTNSFSGNNLMWFTLPDCTYPEFIVWQNYSKSTYHQGNETVPDVSDWFLAIEGYTLTDADVEVVDGVIQSAKPYYSTTEKHVIIPETLDGQTVTGIVSASPGVFQSKYLYYVKIPSTMEYIGQYAFKGNSFFEVDMDDCHNLKIIDEYSFSDCSLDSLYITSDNLTAIRAYAFNNNNITTINLGGLASLDTIGRNAFSANSLTEVKILSNASLKSIEDYAFAYNDIDDLSLTWCTALDHIGEYAFYDNQLVSLNLNSLTGLTSIGALAFADNIFTQIELPTPVVSGYAFNYWENASGDQFAGGEIVTNLGYSYTANLSAFFDIMFNITDGSNPIEGASISFNSETNTTDASGNVLFEDVPEANAVAYEVTALGYTTINSTVDVDENKTVDVTMSPADLAGSVSIADDGAPQYGDVLTADVSEITNNTGSLSYQWERSNNIISGATSATYTLAAADVGEIITVVVSSSVQTSSLESSATSAIGLANGPSAPSAPTLSTRTANSITLTATTGYEYRLGTNSWQSSAEFTGLNQVTEYSFTQRVAQTGTHLASAASTPASYTTYAEDLNGTVSISGSAVFGETLTANTAISNNTGTLIYQWKRGSNDISGATESTYILSVNDIGSEISVVVTSTVQGGSVSSSATATVTKASQSKPDEPVVDSKTTTSITLATLTGGEYSIDAGSNWQSSETFSGLTQGTEYTFVQRLAETSTYYASATSITTSEFTNGAPLAGTVTINGTAKYDEELTADVSGIANNTGTLSYQWLRDGGSISGATSATYTLIVDDIGYPISVEVSSSIQTGSLTSSETAVVLKADAPATPAAPAVASKTTTSITITAIAGGEYSIDNGSNWQTSTVFSGLSQGIEYTFVQRIAETTTHYSSATSDSYAEYTTAEDLAGSVSIIDDGMAQYGETLTADVSGITNNTGTLLFAWNRNGSPISGATASTYTVVQADLYQTITVVVSSSVQGSNLVSNSVNPYKANNDDTPVNPVAETILANEITLETVSGYEYSLFDGGELFYQDSPTFSGLNQLTEYTFYQRIKATATHRASVASSSLVVSTDAETLSGTVTISDDGTPQFGETLTATATISNNTGTLEYQWYRDGGVEIVGAITDSYTLTVDDIGELLYVVVTSTQQYGTVESDLTSMVEKANQVAPDAPTEASVTYNTITLNTVSGCEYAIDGGSFQSSTEFAGLNQLTAYAFTQRLGETSTHNASPLSSVTSISTSAAPLAGTISIDNDGTPQFGEILKANVSGITNNTGTLSYQWKRGESNISGATSATYTLIEDDINAAIKVEVISNIQSGSLISDATATVAKANNSFLPTDPVLSSKTYNSITLTVVAGYEYSINNGVNWQTSAEFTALNDDTSYDLIQRISETNTYYASVNSNALSVTTEVKPANALEGTVTISGTLKYSELLSVSVSDDNNSGTLIYQWKRNGSEIASANSTTYTLTQADIGTNISVEVESSIEIGSISSAATAAIQKADQDAPDAPVLSDKTENSITLVQLVDYEYSIDNITWSTSGEFTGLTAYTAYNLYQRLAETSTHNASAASDVLSVTTLANMLIGTAAVVTDGSPQFGETLAATLTGDNNTGELTYQWVRDGSDIVDATESSYTLALEDIGVTLTVNIGSTIERGVISSSATSVIDKANQDAPIAPVADVIEHNAVTLQEVAGAEYKLGEGDWQSAVLFNGLTPNTQYSFKQRMSESDTHYASDESSATAVTTLKVPLEGAIAIIDDGTPQFGETLTADVSGVTNNTGTLSYQWKRGEDAIVDAINSTYTLVIDDIESEISLVVTSSQESGELTATASAIIAKADAGSPITPELVSKTTNSVTLVELAGYEYSMDATSWQTEAEFASLNASTTYDFYQRIAETDSTNESTASENLAVTTDTLVLEGTVSIVTDGTPQFGEELSLQVTDDNNTGTLSYQWKRGDNNIAEATNDKYTLVLEDIGELISVFVTSSIQLDSIMSDTTVVIEKADQLAPVTPELVSKTDSTVVLVAIDGCEYAIDNGEWQVEALFNNLDAETVYDFTQRLTETDTHKASPTSESLSVTTDAVTPVGYDVTFHVAGQTKGMLAGIVFNGVEYTTDETGELIIPEVLPGTHAYTVTAIGYIANQGTITIIDAPVVEEVILQLELVTAFKVTFKVASENQLIEGALVSMDNYGTAITNDQGIVVFDSVSPALSVGYSVEADGFEQVSATLSVVDANVVEDVEMIPLASETYSVTFIVSDGQNAIQDAWVNLVGYDSVATDMNGRAIIEEVLAGDMLYTVFAEGYEMSQASVTVVDVDITEEVILIPTNIDQSLSFSIRTYPNPVVNQLNVEFDAYFTGQIQLLNTDGKLLMTEDVFDESHVIIDMQNLNQGMFILVVNQVGVVRYERIIKQ